MISKTFMDADLYRHTWSIFYLLSHPSDVVLLHVEWNEISHGVGVEPIHMRKQSSALYSLSCPLHKPGDSRVRDTVGV